MLESVSLAPFKYNKTLFDTFLSTISVRRHVLADNTNVYTANVYLKEALIPVWKPVNRLYSSCDGSGTSKYKNLAIYKGISEAIERLVFFRSYTSSEFGFDINCSTSGMAAFPGLFKASARKLAYDEAIERWCLGRFWTAHLPIIKEEFERGVHYIHFQTPFKHRMIISYLDFLNTDGLSIRAYGFAASERILNAKFKSTVELSRNYEVLNFNHNVKENSLNLLEKRLLFFSSAVGQALFNERINFCKSAFISASKKPVTLVDREIAGEWTKYCYVFRVLFENTFESSHISDFSF